jgi:hypothetical protein
LRLLRLSGTFFATCLLALRSASLTPFAGAHLLLLCGFCFSTPLGSLFAGLTHLLLLLLAVPGNRLGPLDLLSSSADL